jgi:hypothetical protein
VVTREQEKNSTRCGKELFNFIRRPGVPRPGQPVLDVVLSAGQIEAVGTEQLLALHHLTDLNRVPTVATWVGEVRSVVGENGMNPVGNGLNQGPEEVARDPLGDFLVQLGEGELRGPVNSDEEVEPAPPVCTSAMSMWK